MANTDQANSRQPIELPANTLAIVPVRGTVLFPGLVLPMAVTRPKSIAAAQDAVRRGAPLGFILQRNAETEDPGPADLYEIGTSAGVLRYLTAPDGAHHLVCQGQHRFRVRRFLDGFPYLVAEIEEIGESEVRTPEVEARIVHLRRQAEEAISLLPQAPPELGNAVRNAPSAGALADLIASVMDLAPEEKQQVLEIVDAGQRLRRVSELMNYRLEVLRLTRQISEETKEKVEGRNREYLLREQLKTIQKELGESDDGRSEEVAELQETRRRSEDARGGRDPGEARARAARAAARGRGRILDDAQLPRLARRAAVERHHRAHDRPDRGAHHPRPRPLRPRQDQAPHPRISGGAEAEARRQEPDPVLRRTAGRRQDLARPEHRARHGPQVRAREFGRRARRGRDPRPSPHIYRRAPRQHRAGAAQGGRARLRHDARRDRQARRRLPGRSRLGAARSARSRAERHLPRQLPGRAVRSVVGAVHLHRQHDGHGAGRRCATAWS